MTQNKPSNPKSGPSYYRLTVDSVRPETAEASSFVFVPELGEETIFAYEPGQFLSFRIPYKAGDIVRSYSLSSSPSTDPAMTVCIKRVSDGLGSNWFNDHLKAGMSIEATRPSGRFVLRDSAAPLLLIAGGSGITPCISLIKHALNETERHVKLVYANQNTASVIYREQLNELESRFPDRFICQHWLDDKSGFLTAADITAAASGWEQADCYICGPGPLMDLAEETLIDLFGIDATILIERFVSPDDPEQTQDTADVSTTNNETLIESYRLTLDEEEHTVPIGAGETLLEAAIAAGLDAPSSCTEGHCGTCLSWLREGDVEMNSTKALSKRDIGRGYILACQSRPSSRDPIWLDFDI